MDPIPALTAIAVLLLLALVMRWVFKPSRPRRGMPVNASDARELGLLSVVSTVPRADSPAVRARLEEAGIRCSISRRDDGRVDVLVFSGDQTKARQLLQR
ncbi:hypothetical protein [Jatrophihabitans sp.]|uniref:hypothetical protein n=1 Tax=Jatrophihabitans sp. TaxID=1932789 RepID=UPI0030C713F9|nr:hypothetical protein [Jatrophihabitans sp.]